MITCQPSSKLLSTSVSARDNPEIYLASVLYIDSYGTRYVLSLNITGCRVFHFLSWIKYRFKKVRETSRECHNHKPQPFPDPKRKRKPTNLNKHKPNKRTKSTKISSLFPKRGNRNTKRTEKHKNKMTHGKIYNKSPRRINHKATKSKTNTGTTALERSVEQTTGGFKAL